MPQIRVTSNGLPMPALDTATDGHQQTAEMRQIGKAYQAAAGNEKEAVQLLFRAAEARGRSKVFRNLDERVLYDAALRMKRIPCEVGDVIVEHGEPGQNCFIVEHGIFEATISNLPQKKYKRGDYFGEVALLRNALRAATVTCISEGSLWALERTDFRSCVMSLQLCSVVASIGW